MESSPLFMIVMAAVAAFLLFQLYNVLGKKVGRQPEDNAKKAAEKAERDAKAGLSPLPGQPQPQPVRPSPAEAAMMTAAAGLKARDPNFDPARFIDGARQAYETIVRAYAAGDRETLKPLLSSSVMSSFDAGIAAREARGETEAVEFLHTPRADLEEATAKGDRAVAKVRFLAEIRSRLTGGSGEPAEEERRTAEHWTFERSIGASDPNWTLVRVEAASA